MNMPLAILNRRRRGGSATAFSPSTLFALAEPGVWYDPSDLTTLFTDTAGTTPLTTPGQTAALMLDKSKGLVLGAELVTFSSDPANYTLTSSTAATDGAGLLVTKTASNQYVTRSTLMALTAGQSYLITADVQNISCTEGAFRFFLSAGSGGTTLIGTLVGTLNSGTLRGYVHVPAGFTSGYLNVGHSSGGTGQFKLNSISVRELPGNHALQSTTASRPTYGIVPITGRRNLLLNTDTLSTQNVTVANVQHVLSFTGTGTITLSGTSTAGPLVGTGAGNRVSLAFTPTAGTLTLTVSGSVTFAQLERV
jgi:hypothetical protein